MLKIATLSIEICRITRIKPRWEDTLLSLFHLSIFLTPLSSSFILTTRTMPSSPSVSFTGCALLVVSRLTNHLAMPSFVGLWMLEPAKQQNHCFTARVGLPSLPLWRVAFSVSAGQGRDG